jgi:hypothetical protein
MSAGFDDMSWFGRRDDGATTAANDDDDGDDGSRRLRIKRILSLSLVKLWSFGNANPNDRCWRSRRRS